MDKKVLTTLCILVIGLISYAGPFMRVKTASGNITCYEVKDVIEVDFVYDSIPSDLPIEHEYVDLGLPSGALWATYDIGATKPEEHGSIFSWGETVPKEKYNWITYKHHIVTSDSDSLTRYHFGTEKIFTGSKDSIATLLAEDDAATVNWGNEWRMPTIDEVNELITNCQYSWTTLNGECVVKLTAENGNSIYFASEGSVDFFWTSSLYTPHDDSAYILYLYNKTVLSSATCRGNGGRVRAVRVNN